MFALANMHLKVKNILQHFGPCEELNLLVFSALYPLKTLNTLNTFHIFLHEKETGLILRKSRLHARLVASCGLWTLPNTKPDQIENKKPSLPCGGH